ncbi:centrosome-associated protein Alms1a-like [Phlebotomus argentipes]|uniref:centrosome-associated protein Alms1a-like n=1 Tax=Phlebotomus argentipes TaxID=94469 RepID=UPI002892CED6|nr:centrosome-associated protein Alms1a-like [Phlebotomus argentipes]
MCHKRVASVNPKQKFKCHSVNKFLECAFFSSWKREMSHHCPLDKEKYPLSTQILNYYLQYGRNRNLERYLKPARSKSSSEGSLSVATNKYVSQLTKSLENLNVIHNLAEQKAQSDSEGRDQEKPPEDEEVKTAKEKEPESGRRKGKYQFVIDSNVNITIPLNPLNPPQTVDARQQTEALPSTSHQPIESMPAREMPLERKQPVSTSPTSSVISNKQRLEWDSLADIGYEYCSLTEAQMNAQEKAALMKFFTERGLQLNHPLILLSPNLAGVKKKESNEQEKREKPQKAITKINFNEGSFVQSTPLRQPVEEKSSQTIDKEFLSKSVQAEKSALQEQNSDEQTPRELTDLQETRGSFEFFAPALVKVQKNKENISPSSSIRSAVSRNSTGEELKAHISNYLASSKTDGDDFQRSLHKATSLISLLLDSKSISSGTKKELVKKIFEKLEKNYRKSLSNTRSDISTNTSGQSNSQHSRKFYVDEYQKSEFLKEWLKPLTHSTGEYEPPKIMAQSQPVSESSLKSHLSDKNDDSKVSRKSSAKSSAKYSVNGNGEGISKESLAKELQLLRIDQEIQHLNEIKKMIVEERSKKATVVDDPSFGLRDSTQNDGESILSLTGASSWNSHCNMKQFVKNRSKLKTPSDRSTEGRGDIPNSNNVSSVSSGKYYSEPVELNYQGKVASKTKNAITPHSTTFSSLSSDSRDLPSGTRATKSTLKSAQTQTYDSIGRINNAVMNRQQQTKLESIAYIITLDRGAVSRVKHVKEYLEENRPEFLCSANERKNQIELQRQERHRRNDEREKLLKAKTLPMHKLHSLLKPQRHSPKSNSSVVYKQRTRRKYNNLEEQVRKRELQKTKTYKENIKMIQLMFNKNLQRKALQGDTNIPHSKPIIKSI